MTRSLCLWWVKKGEMQKPNTESQRDRGTGKTKGFRGCNCRGEIHLARCVCIGYIVLKKHIHMTDDIPHTIAYKNAYKPHSAILIP